MSRRTLVISARRRLASSALVDVLSKDDLLRELRRGTLVKRLFRYREAVAKVGHLSAVRFPTAMALVLRLLSHGSCRWEDPQGNSERITWGKLGRLARRCVRDFAARPRFLHGVRAEIRTLRASSEHAPSGAELRLEAEPLYLRTDLWFGVEAGGSVAHTAGVVNHLDAFSGRPIVLTTLPLPLIREDVEIHRMPFVERFWDCRDLPTLAGGPVFRARAREIVGDRRLSFVYQRYSLNDYSGLSLSREYGVPLVLEFNGSEIWVSRNWASPLRYEALSREIESMNLRGADVVVVVSQVLRDQLLEAGIEAGKVLVDPNGVDPERYSPDVDGAEVRERHGWQGKTVVGFIGTFGPWHGAEVLAEAFGRLLGDHPEYRDRVRLLMVGDGSSMPDVRRRLERYGALDCAAITGLVPQLEGPKHLAACNILASPHVPNADGSAFFGSPTKLFEYMAMGKGIVASDLEQIGEVLGHDRTAWLVKPGDVGDLAQGIRCLIDDPERCRRLGRAARGEAVAHYTWHAHTERIIEKLRERCGGDSIPAAAEDGSSPKSDGAGR